MVCRSEWHVVFPSGPNQPVWLILYIRWLVSFRLSNNHGQQSLNVVISDVSASVHVCSTISYLVLKMKQVKNPYLVNVSFFYSLHVLSLSQEFAPVLLSITVMINITLVCNITSLSPYVIFYLKQYNQVWKTTLDYVSANFKLIPAFSVSKVHPFWVWWFHKKNSSLFSAKNNTQNCKSKDGVLLV